MMPTMPMMPTIAFPILHLLMSPPLMFKVPFVMAPIVKRTTAMMRTMITHSPMPLLLLVPQGAIFAMLLAVLPMPWMILIITMLLVAVMMISCHCHLVTSWCNQMFLHPTLPHLLAPIAIQNVMPTQKSRGMTLGSIHQMAKMSGSLPTNVYQVLFAAVDPLPQSPIHLNQFPSCLSMLVGSWSQVVQWLDLLWTFLLLPLLPEGIAHKELAHPNTLPHDLWQWLWRHSDCYDLQKVQMMLKGRALIVHLCTRKHRDEILVPALLWFLWLEIMECLNKTEHKQIKFLLGNKKPTLYYAWGEEYYENPKNAGQLDPRFRTCKALWFENNVLGCLSHGCKCVQPH